MFIPMPKKVVRIKLESDHQKLVSSWGELTQVWLTLLLEIVLQSRKQIQRNKKEPG